MTLAHLHNIARRIAVSTGGSVPFRLDSGNPGFVGSESLISHGLNPVSP